MNTNVNCIDFLNGTFYLAIKIILVDVLIFKIAQPQTRVCVYKKKNRD